MNLERIYKKGFITPKCRETLERYRQQNKKDRIRETSIKENEETLSRVLDAMGKPIDEIAIENLEKYWDSKRKSGLKESTVDHQKAIMKKFFRVIGKKHIADELRLRRPRDIAKLPKALLDRDDLNKMLNVVDNQRDKALIFMLWETGCRRSELVKVNIGDITWDEYGAKVVIGQEGETKTGQRTNRLIESAPDLKAWLNVHPFKNDPDKPLFISFAYKNYGKRLDRKGLVWVVKLTGKRAGITKRLFVHAFRHGRALELANLGWSERQMELYLGWIIGSKMSQVYIERSGVLVDDKQLEAYGIKRENGKVLDVHVPKCPDCGLPQSSKSVFCYSCGSVLNTQAGKKIKRKDRTHSDEVLEKKIMEILERILKEKGEKIKD